MLKLEKEKYYGNVEYKLIIKNNINKDRFNRLSTQLKFRLIEGKGKAMYLIGVTDSGILEGISNIEMKNSVSILEKMCIEINAKISKIIEIKISDEKLVNIIKINSLFDVENLSFFI